MPGTAPSTAQLGPVPSGHSTPTTPSHCAQQCPQPLPETSPVMPGPISLSSAYRLSQCPSCLANVFPGSCLAPHLTFLCFVPCSWCPGVPVMRWDWAGGCNLRLCAVHQAAATPGCDVLGPEQCGPLAQGMCRSWVLEIPGMGCVQYWGDRDPRSGAHRGSVLGLLGFRHVPALAGGWYTGPACLVWAKADPGCGVCAGPGYRRMQNLCVGSGQHGPQAWGMCWVWVTGKGQWLQDTAPSLALSAQGSIR